MSKHGLVGWKRSNMLTVATPGWPTCFAAPKFQDQTEVTELEQDAYGSTTPKVSLFPEKRAQTRGLPEIYFVLLRVINRRLSKIFAGKLILKIIFARSLNHKVNCNVFTLFYFLPQIICRIYSGNLHILYKHIGWAPTFCWQLQLSEFR